MSKAAASTKSAGDRNPLCVAIFAAMLAIATMLWCWGRRRRRRAAPQSSAEEATPSPGGCGGGGGEACDAEDGAGNCGGAGGDTCAGCGGGGGGDGGLDPIMEVSYNAQQMVKQSLLLEDHLNQPRKRCRDCICKHMLTLSALAEEAVSLSKEDADRALMQGAAQFYDWVYWQWREGIEPCELAVHLRKTRKHLVQAYSLT